MTLDEALASRREWMEKTTVCRQELSRLRALLEEAASALAGGKGKMSLERQKLIERLRQGAR